MYTRGPPERGIGAGIQANRGPFAALRARMTPRGSPEQSSRTRVSVRVARMRYWRGGAGSEDRAQHEHVPARRTHRTRAGYCSASPGDTTDTRSSPRFNHGGHIDRDWTRAKQRSAAVSQSSLSLILRPRDPSPSPGCLEACWSDVDTRKAA